MFWRKMQHENRHKYRHKTKTRPLCRVDFFLYQRRQSSQRVIYPLPVVALLYIPEHERNALPRYADQRRKLGGAYQVK